MAATTSSKSVAVDALLLESSTSPPVIVASSVQDWEAMFRDYEQHIHSEMASAPDKKLSIERENTLMHIYLFRHSGLQALLVLPVSDTVMHQYILKMEGFVRSTSLTTDTHVVFVNEGLMKSIYALNKKSEFFERAKITSAKEMLIKAVDPKERENNEELDALFHAMLLIGIREQVAFFTMTRKTMKLPKDLRWYYEGIPTQWQEYVAFSPSHNWLPGRIRIRNDYRDQLVEPCHPSGMFREPEAAKGDEKYPRIRFGAVTIYHYDKNELKDAKDDVALTTESTASAVVVTTSPTVKDEKGTPAPAVAKPAVVNIRPKSTPLIVGARFPEKSVYDFRSRGNEAWEVMPWWWTIDIQIPADRMEEAFDILCAELRHSETNHNLPIKAILHRRSESERKDFPSSPLSLQLAAVETRHSVDPYDRRKQRINTFLCRVDLAFKLAKPQIPALKYTRPAFLPVELVRTLGTYFVYYNNEVRVIPDTDSRIMKGVYEDLKDIPVHRWPLICTGQAKSGLCKDGCFVYRDYDLAQAETYRNDAFLYIGKSCYASLPPEQQFNPEFPGYDPIGVARLSTRHLPKRLVPSASTASSSSSDLDPKTGPKRARPEGSGDGDVTQDLKRANTPSESSGTSAPTLDPKEIGLGDVDWNEFSFEPVPLSQLEIASPILSEKVGTDTPADVKSSAPADPDAFDFNITEPLTTLATIAPSASSASTATPMATAPTETIPTARPSVSEPFIMSPLQLGPPATEENKEAFFSSTSAGSTPASIPPTTPVTVFATMNPPVATPAPGPMNETAPIIPRPPSKPIKPARAPIKFLAQKVLPPVRFLHHAQPDISGWGGTAFADDVYLAILYQSQHAIAIYNSALGLYVGFIQMQAKYTHVRLIGFRRGLVFVIVSEEQKRKTHDDPRLFRHQIRAFTTTYLCNGVGWMQPEKPGVTEGVIDAPPRFCPEKTGYTTKTLFWKGPILPQTATSRMQAVFSISPSGRYAVTTPDDGLSAQVWNVEHIIAQMGFEMVSETNNFVPIVTAQRSSSSAADSKAATGGIHQRRVFRFREGDDALLGCEITKFNQTTGRWSLSGVVSVYQRSQRNTSGGWESTKTAIVNPYAITNPGWTTSIWTPVYILSFLRASRPMPSVGDPLGPQAKFVGGTTPAIVQQVYPVLAASDGTTFVHARSYIGDVEPGYDIIAVSTSNAQHNPPRVYFHLNSSPIYIRVDALSQPNGVSPSSLQRFTGPVSLYAAEIHPSEIVERIRSFFMPRLVAPSMPPFSSDPNQNTSAGPPPTGGRRGRYRTSAEIQMTAVFAEHITAASFDVRSSSFLHRLKSFPLFSSTLPVFTVRGQAMHLFTGEVLATTVPGVLAFPRDIVISVGEGRSIDLTAVKVSDAIEKRYRTPKRDAYHMSLTIAEKEAMGIPINNSTVERAYLSGKSSVLVLVYQEIAKKRKLMCVTPLAAIRQKNEIAHRPTFFPLRFDEDYALGFVDATNIFALYERSSHRIRFVDLTPERVNEAKSFFIAVSKDPAIYAEWQLPPTIGRDFPPLSDVIVSRYQILLSVVSGHTASALRIRYDEPDNPHVVASVLMNMNSEQRLPVSVGLFGSLRKRMAHFVFVAQTTVETHIRFFDVVDPDAPVPRLPEPTPPQTSGDHTATEPCTGPKRRARDANLPTARDTKQREDTKATGSGAATVIAVKAAETKEITVISSSDDEDEERGRPSVQKKPKTRPLLPEEDEDAAELEGTEPEGFRHVSDYRPVQPILQVAYGAVDDGRTRAPMASAATARPSKALPAAYPSYTQRISAPSSSSASSASASGSGSAGSAASSARELLVPYRPTRPPTIRQSGGAVASASTSSAVQMEIAPVPTASATPATRWHNVYPMDTSLPAPAARSDTKRGERVGSASSRAVSYSSAPIRVQETKETTAVKPAPSTTSSSESASASSSTAEPPKATDEETKAEDTTKFTVFATAEQILHDRGEDARHPRRVARENEFLVTKEPFFRKSIREDESIRTAPDNDGRMEISNDGRLIAFFGPPHEPWMLLNSETSDTADIDEKDEPAATRLAKSLEYRSKAVNACLIFSDDGIYDASLSGSGKLLIQKHYMRNFDEKYQESESLTYVDEKNERIEFIQFLGHDLVIGTRMVLNPVDKGKQPFFMRFRRSSILTGMKPRTLVLRTKSTWNSALPVFFGDQLHPAFDWEPRGMFLIGEEDYIGIAVGVDGDNPRLYQAKIGSDVIFHLGRFHPRAHTKTRLLGSVELGRVFVLLPDPHATTLSKPIVLERRSIWISRLYRGALSSPTVGVLALESSSPTVGVPALESSSPTAGVPALESVIQGFSGLPDQLNRLIRLYSTPVYHLTETTEHSYALMNMLMEMDVLFFGIMTLPRWKYVRVGPFGTSVALLSGEFSERNVLFTTPVAQARWPKDVKFDQSFLRDENAVFIAADEFHYAVLLDHVYVSRDQTNVLVGWRVTDKTNGRVIGLMAEGVRRVTYDRLILDVKREIATTVLKMRQEEYQTPLPVVVAEIIKSSPHRPGRLTGDGLAANLNAASELKEHKGFSGSAFIDPHSIWTGYRPGGGNRVYVNLIARKAPPPGVCIFMELIETDSDWKRTTSVPILEDSNPREEKMVDDGMIRQCVRAITLHQSVFTYIRRVVVDGALAMDYLMMQRYDASPNEAPQELGHILCSDGFHLVGGAPEFGRVLWITYDQMDESDLSDLEARWIVRTFETDALIGTSGKRKSAQPTTGPKHKRDAEKKAASSSSDGKGTQTASSSGSAASGPPVVSTETKSESKDNPYGRLKRRAGAELELVEVNDASEATSAGSSASASASGMEYSLTSTRDRRMVPAGSTATASASTATLRSLVHSGSGAAGVNPMNRYLKRSRLPSPPKEEDVVFAPPPSEFDTELWKFLSNTLPHELVGQIVSFTGTAMPTIHVLYKTQIQQNIAPDGSGYRVRFNSLTPLGNGRVNGKWPRFADAGIEPNRSTPQIGSHRLETPPSSAVTSHATDNEMPTRIYLTSARIPFRMSNMRCVMGVGETRMIADLIGSINLAPRDGSSQFLRFALDSRTEDMYFECMIGDDTIIGISDNALITSTPAGYARIWIAERSVESASPPAIPAGPPFTRFISAGTVSRSVLSDEKMTSSHIIFAGFLPNSPRDMGFIISEDEVDPASLELHEGPRFCIVRSVTSKDGPSVIAVQKVNLRHWNRRVSYGLVLSESGPGARSVSAGSAIVGPGYFLYTVQSDGWYRIMQQSYAEADTALVDRLIYQASGPVSGSGDTYDDTMVFAGSLLKGILTASLPIKQKSGEFVPSSDFMRVVMFEFDAFVTGGQQPQDYNVAKLTESVIGGQPPQDKNVAKFPLAVALHSVYARGIQEPKFYTKTGNKGGNVEWWMLMPDASGLIGIRPSRPQLLVPLNKRNGRLHLESMPKQNEILDVLLRERVYVTFITLVVEDEHRLAAVTYIPGESTARVQVYEFHQPKLALDVRLTKRQLDRMPVDFEFTMKLVPLKTSGPTRIYFESRQMQIAEDDADAKDVTVRICYRILQITGPYIIVDVIRGPKEEAGMKLMYTTLTQHAKTAATAQRWNLSGPQAFTSNKPRKTGFTDPYMIGVVPSTRLYAYMSLMFVNPEDVKRTDGGKVKIRLCLELEDPAKSAEPPYIVLSAPWMVRADTLKTISYESIFLGSRSFIYAIQTEYGLRVVMQSYESSSPSVAVDTLIYSEGRTYDAVVRQDIEGEEGGPANVRQDPALTGSFREGVVHVFRCVYKAMDALRVTTIEL